MCQFDGLIDHIRQSARDAATKELLRKEEQSRLSAFPYSIGAKFSESDKEKYLQKAEDEAVSRLNSFLANAARGEFFRF